jgi:hypothetical protein
MPTFLADSRHFFEKIVVCSARSCRRNENTLQGESRRSRRTWPHTASKALHAISSGVFVSNNDMGKGQAMRYQVTTGNEAQSQHLKSVFAVWSC